MIFSLSPENYIAVYETVFDFSKAKASLIKVSGFRRKKNKGKQVFQ